MTQSPSKYANNPPYRVSRLEIDIQGLDPRAPSGMIYYDGELRALPDSKIAGRLPVLEQVDMLHRDEISERALWEHRFTNIAV